VHPRQHQLTLFKKKINKRVEVFYYFLMRESLPAGNSIAYFPAGGLNCLTKIILSGSCGFFMMAAIATAGGKRLLGCHTLSDISLTCKVPSTLPPFLVVRSQTSHYLMLIRMSYVCEKLG